MIAIPTTPPAFFTNLRDIGDDTFARIGRSIDSFHLIGVCLLILLAQLEPQPEEEEQPPPPQPDEEEQPPPQQPWPQPEDAQQLADALHPPDVLQAEDTLQLDDVQPEAQPHFEAQQPPPQHVLFFKSE